MRCGSIVVRAGHPAVAKMIEEYHGLWAYMGHGMTAAPFWLALAGIGTAWYLYIARPDLPKVVAGRFGILYAIVERKYGFDELYSWLFAGGARAIGTACSRRCSTMTGITGPSAASANASLIMLASFTTRCRRPALHCRHSCACRRTARAPGLGR